ncbi:hypothetical protein F5Y19DRAFT_476028 [Xylariaceae sp. FL1651]|nr:hypothetical protein F5Y19DRAFT_476028 [Xylariaceae sp. FL1651]
MPSCLPSPAASSANEDLCATRSPLSTDLLSRSGFSGQLAETCVQQTQKKEEEEDPSPFSNSDDNEERVTHHDENEGQLEPEATVSSVTGSQAALSSDLEIFCFGDTVSEYRHSDSESSDSYSELSGDTDSGYYSESEEDETDSEDGSDDYSETSDETDQEDVSESEEYDSDSQDSSGSYHDGNWTPSSSSMELVWTNIPRRPSRLRDEENTSELEKYDSDLEDNSGLKR